MTGARARFLGGAGSLLAALALSACGVKSEAVVTPAPKPFVVALDGSAAAEHAPLYVAAANGRLRAVGLETMLQASSAAAGSLNALAVGKANVAEARQDEVLLARDRGQLLVSIAALGGSGANGSVLVVPQHNAERDGEDLRAFLHALAQGAGEAQANPAAAAALLVKANPALLGNARKAARTRRLHQLERAVVANASTSAGKPFGFQNPSTWSTLASSMFTRHLLHTDPETLAPPYTNEYLPGEGL